jgi:hypothetical protein
MLTVDMGIDIKEKNYNKVMGNIAGIMMSSFLVKVVTSGFTYPDDEEEQLGWWFDALFGTIVSSVPVLGPYAMSYFRGYDPSLSPIDQVAKSVQYSYVKFQNEEYTEAGIDLVGNIAILCGVGLPFYSQIRKTVRGAIDLIEGETDDLRRLNYSASALGER